MNDIIKKIIINNKLHDKVIKKPAPDTMLFFKEKLYYFEKLINKTILSTHKYKKYDIYTLNETNICIDTLKIIFTKITTSLNNIYNPFIIDEQMLINNIKIIHDDISRIFKISGTEHFEDLIKITFNNDYITKYINIPEYKDKYELLKLYFHPISYKIFDWKESDINKSIKISKTKIIEDFMIVGQSNNLECFDLARNSNIFHTKVYGIKVSLQNSEHKKTIIVFGIIDNIMLDCLNSTYIKNKLAHLILNKPLEPSFINESFNRYIQCLTLKDLFIYNNEDLYTRYLGYLIQVNLIKSKPISQLVFDFLNSDIYAQRTTLVQLLINSNEHEYQYLAYMLYDLLSNESNGSLDTLDQTLIMDSLPYNIKNYFKDAMTQSIKYKTNLDNFDINKIPLEQQIYLMKANNNVKERAIIKLKEVKAKSDESGSKARHYLEGLLKIPFNIYKEEPILTIMNNTKNIFSDMITKLNNKSIISSLFPIQTYYTNLEINKYTNIIKNEYINKLVLNIADNIKVNILPLDKNNIINIIININNINKKYNFKINKISYSGKSLEYMKNLICNYITNITSQLHTSYKNDIINSIFDVNVNVNVNINIASNSETHSFAINTMPDTCNKINKNFDEIVLHMNNISKILDDSIYGHDKAKRQIERVIGQWINGEHTGYCFGFEGPPGIGKTSLAKKGISECLKDGNGLPRPFSLIAIGGSSNGCILDGHNYTYVGSTWGKIVDIIMEKKCMNPIIFIDELDKISNTENGKELIGILTHLIDPSQNDTFQDKFFNGIDIDMSKTLFIFSYNDANLIDKILLDRIHRIKFDYLSLDDKLTIVKIHILPELLKKMGLENLIIFSDDIIEYIINEYTYESGVRKLKQILFEIIGEINLSILKQQDIYEFPIIITREDIKFKFLKDRNEIKIKQIHKSSKIGIINGLWANSIGKGGILPIEASLFPSNIFMDLKLTGLQGDVMKESMSVAKSLAWSLLTFEEQKNIYANFNDTKLQGIHIHCPEGATPKDGPSAGTAITIVIYSLLTNKKIKNNVAITGEICLQGKITAIGGLSLKLLGGLQSGIKTFIFPKENDKDFNDWLQKYKGNLDDITFKSVENIDDILDIVFE
jgi:ATP-dependent Lon protease